MARTWAARSSPSTQLAPAIIVAFPMNLDAFNRRQVLAAETMPQGDQFTFDGREVVDFTVKSDGEALVGRQHRLITGMRQINNRQAPVPESNPGRVINPDALGIGTAMAERVDHFLNIGLDLLGRG